MLSPEYSIQDGHIEEQDRLGLSYDWDDLERLRMFIEKTDSKDAIAWIREGDGLIPFYATKDDAGVITYSPTFAIHGVRIRHQGRDVFDSLGEIARNGIKGLHQDRGLKNNNFNTLFENVVNILQRGFVGDGSKNISVYPPDTSYFPIADKFSEVDKDMRIRFFIKMYKIHPSRMDDFLHRQMPFIDNYKPSNITPGSGKVNYADFVEPEDMSVLIVSDRKLSPEKLEEKQQELGEKFALAVGRDVLVEAINAPTFTDYSNMFG